MLPQDFLDWWFAPWTYAAATSSILPAHAGRIGLRDGYRLWCKAAKVSPDLPQRFDPAWHIAAAASPAELLAAARLFAGLIAAREHNQPVLGELGFADRKWCVSIAATQPLRGCDAPLYVPEDGIEVRGLVELVRRAAPQFPGLWSRLRLMLSVVLAERVEALLADAAACSGESEAAVLRAQRCWTLCRARAAAAIDATADGLGEQATECAHPTA